MKNYLSTGTDKKKKFGVTSTQINKNSSQTTGGALGKLKDISKEDECELELNRMLITEHLQNKIKINEVQASLNSKRGYSNSIAFRKGQIQEIMKETKVSQYYL